ncbi:MAG TPA: hypothetical protein PKW21_12690, partial [Rhabdaerophilum sp.]|nr:hypothetical protein [Rhabdaerophilum sp.]
MAKPPTTPPSSSARSRAVPTGKASRPLDAHLAELLNPGLNRAAGARGPRRGMAEAPQAGYSAGAAAVDPALAKALGLPESTQPSRRRSAESEPVNYADIAGAKPRRVMQGNVVPFPDDMKMGGGLDGLSEEDTISS